MAIKFGDKKISKIYVGDKLVMESGISVESWLNKLLFDQRVDIYSGEIYQGSGKTAFPKVEIPKNKKTVSILRPDKKEISVDCCFYDEKNKFISGKTIYGNAITIPLNAKFLRYSSEKFLVTHFFN